MQNPHGTINRSDSLLMARKCLVITIFLFLNLILFTAVSYSQESDLEKSVYKKPTATKKKPVVTKKKPAPRKSTSNQNATKRSAATPSKTRRATTRGGSNPNLINFIFTTPGPVQEIWLGEEKLGTSNDESVLEKSLKAGNYLVSVRTPTGDVILKSQLVKVSTEQSDAVLSAGTDSELDLADTTAEEELKNGLQDTIEASQKVLKILDDYASPLTTNTISRSDWEYVLKLANTNEINNFTAGQIEAQRWFASGQIELSKGAHADALAAFLQSKTFMPASALPDYAIGETYLANGQPDLALPSYSNAVAVDPKFALGHAKLGDIYSRSNKPKESAASYKAALENGFDSPKIRFALAKELMKNKRWDEAASNLESVLKEAPAGDVYITLGDLYRELKRPISTYEAYRRATELLPTSSVAFYKLGELLFDEREYDKSKAAFEKAMDLDGNGEKINVSLARKFIREASQKLR